MCYDHLLHTAEATKGSVRCKYFHDIEKLYKYTSELVIDKDKYYNVTLPTQGIFFTEEEINALTYIHGEGADYSSEMRMMNSLAAFCHVESVEN